MLGVSIKKDIAEVHSQTAIEGVSGLQEDHGIEPGEVEAIEVETYERVNFIMGGGAGDKHDVRTREPADHSLPYVLSVVLLDGQVMPPQYEMARILADDVQGLLLRVKISCAPDLTARYPGESPVRIKITMKDSAAYTKEKSSCEGFPATPMSWESVRAKFDTLCEVHTRAGLRGTR
jgi:2-methylcitrate dehydratase